MQLDTYNNTMNNDNIDNTLNINNNTNIYNIVPGISGLNNIGNTCYLNAVLQPLCHTYPLIGYLITRKFVSNLEYNIYKKLAIKKRQELKLSENEHVQVLQNEYEIMEKDTLIKSMMELFEALWRENCKVSPITIKNKIGNLNNEFQGFTQNDSQEVLNLILDTIHEESKIDVKVSFTNLSEKLVNVFMEKKKFSNEYKQIEREEDKIEFTKKYLEFKNLNKNEFTILNAYNFWKKYISKNYSIITDLFTGLYYSTVSCSECDYVSESFEPFTMLNVETSADGRTTLQECLKNFSNEEILTDGYKCNLCNKNVIAKKKLHIWEAPQILIIQLKRFKNIEIEKTSYYNHNIYNTGYSYMSYHNNYGGLNNTHRQIKTNSVVEFPLIGLELNDNYHHLNKKKNKYNLYAITEHNGTCQHGHYISYCKNNIDNKWYKYDDAVVYYIPDDNITEEILTKNAYILYYIKDKN